MRKRRSHAERAADEHAMAFADLQEAVDRTVGEGVDDEHRINIRRAIDREQAAHEELSRRRRGERRGPK
jgi:hypothetical protein